jgi:hypothetical protein
MNDRTGAVFRQPALDLPDQASAPLLVELGGLAVDQLVDLGIAVAVGVVVGATGVGLVECLVGIVDGTLAMC